MPSRVLHVTESLGGGVTSAVLAMVESTPQVDHHLAVWPRRQHSHADTGERLDCFAGVTTLPVRTHRAVRELRDLVAALRPGHVHAHSSYAGLLTRSVDLGVDVVYSPHCFAFERRDLAPSARAGVRRVERALAPRTSVLVACSPHEAGLATDLGHRDVVVVPNRAATTPDVRARFSEDLRVVTLGRIAPQKDWQYLLAVKGYLEGVLRCRVTWQWLGGGDHAGERALRAHGVDVVGWVPRAEALHRLAAAQVYVHTAAWEGAPVSVLEAAAIGLPIAARSIPALESLEVPGLSTTPAGLAARIVDLHDPAHWAAEQRRSLLLDAAHTTERQRDQLHAAYRLIPAELAVRELAPR